MLNLSVARFINTYVFQRLGIKIEKYNRTFDSVRTDLLRILSPDLVIDGGANIGQWATQVLNVIPDLKVWSFEPLLASRSKIEIRASRSHFDWTIFPFALGEINDRKSINVSSNSQMSSSFLNSSFHSKIHPNISFLDSEDVDVRSLNSFSEELKGYSRVYLKLDVQGFEMSAINGALNIIDQVAIVEVESSFTALYEGETEHHELVANLKQLGFTPWCISVPSSESSGRQFALDTLLVRTSLISELDYLGN